MIELIPLFQTSIWVGLIVWLVTRYHNQVCAVLTAVQERIARGSSVKAGPFELGEDMRPQNVPEQNKRIDEELQQIEATSAQNSQTSQPMIAAASDSKLKQTYFLAEDLVMRELQSEFGVMVNRSVGFQDFGLDGIFAKEGAGFGIEVKYIKSGSRIEHLEQIIVKTATFTRRLHWSRFTFILALVCEQDGIISTSDLERLQELATKSGLPLMTRVYTMSDLTSKFGLT